MASYLSLVLVAVAISITISSARVIPAEPLSVMLDAYGNPVLFLREKRAPINRPIIPHRAMMFTGYYRPSRRSYSTDQAAGVFAQGNAVSGGSYLGGVQSPHLNNGPEPIDEPEVSSAQAEAAPVPEDIYHSYEPSDQPQVHEEQNKFSGFPNQEQNEGSISDPEPLPYDIDTPAPASGVENHEEVPPVEGEGGKVAPGKLSPPVKKGKKTPVDEDEDEDEDEFEEEEAYSPFTPVKGNRRRNGYVPNLNNFFPMMFSFPGLSRRGGSSSGSPPGVVTAIANSYSTGKGGVASSVATAYGGSPSGKKAARRAPVAEE